VITVAGASAIAGTDRSQARTTLRMSIAAEPPSLDPGLATDTVSADMLFKPMDPLIGLGPPPALKAVPGAAASWSVKGANVTLNLRRSVRWTNGQSVTAADYVWSWLRTISPELGADYAYQFYGIKGAEAYNGCKSNCGALRAKVGIKALGPYKLRIQLVSPQPWFIQQLSHTSFLPVNKGAVTKHGRKWTEPGKIVTDGPFKLSSWKHDASITLVKNTKWRNAKSVKLTKIEMPIIVDGTTAENAFSAGNIDVNQTPTPPVDVPKWKKTKFWKVFKALGTYFYGFNVKNIPDVNQRRAMAFAIDRSQIVKYITQAGQVPARGFTPAGIAGRGDDHRAQQDAGNGSAEQGQGVHGQGQEPEQEHHAVHEQRASPHQDRDRRAGLLDEARPGRHAQSPGVEAVPPVPRTSAELRRRRVPPGLGLRLPGCVQRSGSLGVRFREQQHELVQQEVRRPDRQGHVDAEQRKACGDLPAG